MKSLDDHMAASGGILNVIPDVPRPEGNDYAVVSQWARKVLDSFGLNDWRFGFDGARRRMGCCDYRELRITLSRHFVRMNGDLEIRETMLHEIAHALVGGGHGHGPVWKAMARRIGCKPVRCGRADMPAGRIVATCPCCLKSYRRHRRPRAGVRHWCRACGPKRGSLTWGVPA